MQNHPFLHRIIDDLLQQHSDLTYVKIILPGKRPVIFFKQILLEKGYQGFLPQFVSIQDLIKEIANVQSLSGVALWLFSYQVYLELFPEESIDSFLKWFPLLLKDWDDILKFCNSDQSVLNYMLSEERIKNWAKDLGELPDKVLRNLDFWTKMNQFLPRLKQELLNKNWANEGLIHQVAKTKIDCFARDTQYEYVFCGFNALTPSEMILIKSLLQLGKAKTYFNTDEYYVFDEKQEAGHFLREIKKWKEFNSSRAFNWVDSDFKSQKQFKVYKSSGDVAQAKFLNSIFDEILRDIPNDLYAKELSQTALVLLDEKMLPLVIENLHPAVRSVNITMGYPIKNLDYSIFFRKLIHLHKQLAKKANKYYYLDLLAVMESIALSENDQFIYKAFFSKVKARNWVYISSKQIDEHLGELSFVKIFEKQNSVKAFLNSLLEFCNQEKERDLNSLLYENISLFQRDFMAIDHLLQQFKIPLSLEALEVVLNYYLKNESIDFEGQPLEGLQIMGLLETRLLNFKNLIFLSLNEGKLPLGNSQNSLIPYDVKFHEKMNTFVENDSIYAYHFYRLLQNSEKIFMLYNSNTSGLNTGEKSRFLRQIESESSHEIEQISINSSPEPINNEAKSVKKTAFVLQKLEDWKQSISPTHLISYLYNPYQFYLSKLLKIRQENDMEEDLSEMNYGNLVHSVLEHIYKPWEGQFLNDSELIGAQNTVENVLSDIIVNKMKHQPDLYDLGMNYFHKKMAIETVKKILKKEILDLKQGKKIKILYLEKKFSGELELNSPNGEAEIVKFSGIVDRIDEVDGVVRVIDYKSTGSKKPIVLTEYSRNDKNKFIVLTQDHKFQVQLGFYAYCLLSNPKNEINCEQLQCGIWAFDQPEFGVELLSIENNQLLAIEDLRIYTDKINDLILEIIDPNTPFIEKLKAKY